MAALAAIATVTEDDPDGPPLIKLRKQYNDWAKAKTNEQTEQRESRHYYHGDQWTSDERAKLGKRRQPVITYNRTSRKVDGITGVIGRMRQDPKAYPRTGKQDKGAELGTAAIRYALDRTRWEDKETEAVRDCGMTGIGVIEFQLVPGDHGDPELEINVIDDGFFYDPRSFRPDFSDAKYMGVAKLMHIDDVKELASEDLWDQLDSLASGQSDFARGVDTDRDNLWLNVKEKHVRVALHYWKDRTGWRWALYTADILLNSGESLFYDESGRTICGIFPWSAYVDHDGDRYGFVRNLKSPQDELNMRRSKALHLLNTRRIKMEKGAVDDVEKFRAESMRPDGVLEFQRGFNVEFEDATKSSEWNGQMEMLAEAKAEIENFGPTLVEKGMEKSGRAIALLQQSGLAELGPFITAYRAWKLRIYRAAWTTIQRYWTAERWIRVTDDQGLAQFVQINGVGLDQFGMPVMVNALGSLDVDVVLDDAPDAITTMADALETLQAAMANGVPIPPQVIIKLMSLPASLKDEILGILEQMNQPEPPDPGLEAAKQVALDQESAKTANYKAQALKNFADASKTMGETMRPPPQPQQPAQAAY